MTTLLLIGIGFLTQLPYWAIVALIIAGLAWEIVGRWQVHFRRQQDPYRQQLTMGSHGAAFILLTPLLVHQAFHERWTYYLPRPWMPFVWPAAFAFMAFGAYWLVLAVSRTRAYSRDAQLITRSVAKIGVGIFAFYMLASSVLPPIDWDQPYRHWAATFLLFFSLWCFVTGAGKLVLLLRPFPWEWELNEEEESPYFMNKGLTPPQTYFGKWRRTFFAGWGWRR